MRLWQFLVLGDMKTAEGK